MLGSLAALAACGPGDNDPGPGGVTVAEAKALDEAAEMIEARRPPEGLVEDLANAGHPAASGGQAPAVPPGAE